MNTSGYYGCHNCGKFYSPHRLKIVEILSAIVVGEVYIATVCLKCEEKLDKMGVLAQNVAQASEINSNART